MQPQMSPQPTHVEGLPTGADYAVLLQRIEPLAQKYEANLERQNVDDIGFNLFELISDQYYRETFHSDILNALLDPDGKHGEKQKYLNFFLEFLRSQHEAKIKLSDYSNAQVKKEEGRIDILIKGCKHAIIIENKINGATDQPRQLPDYLRKVKDDGYDCDAIIYLRLHEDAPPDMANWTYDERREVKAILKRICAYDGSDDETKKDLLKGWILKCIDESKENSNVQHILRQYGDIIKKLGRSIMNKPIMEKFYEIIVEGEGENLKTALSLKKMLDDLILYRVQNIFDKFKDDSTPFDKIRITAGRDDAYFEGRIWKDANLGLDIVVGQKSYSFRFWDKEDDSKGSKGHAKALLQKMDCLNDYTPYAAPNTGWFCKEFAFPSEEKDLIKHITDFKKKLAETVASG